MGGVQSIIVLSGGGRLGWFFEIASLCYEFRNTDFEKIAEMMAFGGHRTKSDIEYS